MKKIIPFLKQFLPAFFKVSVGGFIVISVALYFQSCTASMHAEKFDYHSIVGKCKSNRVIVDTIR